MCSVLLFPSSISKSIFLPARWEFGAPLDYLIRRAQLHLPVALHQQHFTGLDKKLLWELAHYDDSFTSLTQQRRQVYYGAAVISP